jgi:hypothetical protein
MPEQPTTPPTNPSATPGAPAPKTQPKGYFNQAQLDDIKIAEEILPPARDDARKAALAAKDITDAYVTGLADAIKEARQKIAETGQGADDRKAATLNADDAERELITALQGIQAAAKQKHRMLAEDDDPATNFSTDGYLIGQRLNPNRAGLLQSAATLLARAKVDQLPGNKTPESITAIETAIRDYQAATATQAERDQEASDDRIARDKLIKKINARRMAIQHAADALWPYTDEDHHPIRRLFKLPLDRPFNG